MRERGGMARRGPSFGQVASVVGFYVQLVSAYLDPPHSAPQFGPSRSCSGDLALTPLATELRSDRQTRFAHRPGATCAKLKNRELMFSEIFRFDWEVQSLLFVHVMAALGSPSSFSTAVE
jgi:hypothetical protein